MNARPRSRASSATTGGFCLFGRDTPVGGVGVSFAPFGAAPAPAGLAPGGRGGGAAAGAGGGATGFVEYHSRALTISASRSARSAA